VFGLLGRTTAVAPAAPLTPQECVAPLVFLAADSLSALAVVWSESRAHMERLG
jgi:hypothetical protein